MLCSRIVAVDGFGGKYCEFNGLAVEHGQGAGQAEAGGAGVGVGVAAVAVDAAAEGLGGCEELHVDFKPDDGLVLCADFGREQGRSSHRVPF